MASVTNSVHIGYRAALYPVVAYILSKHEDEYSTNIINEIVCVTVLLNFDTANKQRNYRPSIVFSLRDVNR